MTKATVIPQVFVEPPHKPGETFAMDFLYDGTREGMIAASMAYLAQAPEYVTGTTIVFEGETIHLDAKLARGMTTN